MTVNQEKELLILAEELDNLKKLGEGLSYVFDRCSSFEIKEEYSKEEDLCYEALTAKFSRCCEYLLNKVFRSVERLDLEYHNRPGMLNYAEKKGLITDADRLFKIYKIRNAIVHEYDPNVSSLYSSILREVPFLLDSIRRTLSECQRQYL